MVRNLERVKAFVFDVDGVLTDGSTICMQTGDEAMRIFNEKDGHGLRMAALNGFGLGVITGSRSEAVRTRLTRFGIRENDVYLHSKNKILSFDDYCHRHGYSPAEVAYLGDDIPDAALLRYCGLGIAPADAADEAKEAADYVSDYPGGRLFVRKSIEMVLKAQGKWVFNVNDYDAMF